MGQKTSLEQERLEAFPALVLGDRGIARMITQQLKDEGFGPIYQYPNPYEELPSLFNPNRFQELTRILSEFAASSNSKGIVHPGVSVWAEKPELLNVTHQLGLTLISPTAKNMAFFNHKFQFLMEAEKIGIPNLVLSYDPMYTQREIEEFIRATKQKVPFVLKAAKGGGSFGLFVVNTHESGFQQVWQQFTLWAQQLRQKLGEVILFAERYLEGARLISVPFARFRDGSFKIFPMVDASLQSRYRKILEMCPATYINSEVKQNLEKWTKLLADHCEFVGVGVLEYLVDGSHAYLIEGMTRLNTSFPLWEKIEGTKAVSWQLATLQPGEYSGHLGTVSKKPSGISLRIYAENSFLSLPQLGKVHETAECQTWKFESTEAELCMNYRSGETLKVTDSGILGNLFVFGDSHTEALRTAPQILENMSLAGSFQANLRYLLELVTHPWVREGVFHAGFIDEDFLPEINPPKDFLRQSLSLFISALPKPPEGERAEAKLDYFYWTIGGQWLKLEIDSDPVIQWKDSPFAWQENGQTGISGTLSLPDGTSTRICAFPLWDRWNVRLGSWFIHVRLPRKVNPKFAASAPGRVHAIFFKTDAVVPAHEPVILIETFGILIPYSLPRTARILLWKVKAEDMVTLGQKLADFEWVEG